MQIVVEIIGSLVYFEYTLFATFVTGTARAIVLFLTFISMGLLENLAGQFQAYFIPAGSQETLIKEMFFRNLKNNVMLKR